MGEPRLILVPPEEVLLQGKLRVVSFKIPVEELERVDAAARRLGMSRSELIRHALQKTLQEVAGKRNL